MIYICNSFTLNMLSSWRIDPTDGGAQSTLTVTTVMDPVAYLFEAETRHGPAISAVGHADTASVFSSELGRIVPCNRISVALTDDDELLVGQYHGPRLPEGCSTLPEGAVIRWLTVTVD